MHRGTSPSRRPVIEDLEPRILFAADHPAGIVAAALIPPADATTAQAVAPPAATQRTSEIVFIDSRVANKEALFADIGAQAAAGRAIEAIEIDAARDGLSQVSAALDGRSAVSAVHVISHGAAAHLLLGSTVIDDDTLLMRADELAGWGDHLSSGADLLLYGCDIGAGADGANLLKGLAQLTGADVAASTDTTGAALFGGNWSLEAQVGRIETESAIDAAGQQLWQQELTTYVVTNANDSGAGSLRQAIQDANANPGADLISFAISGTGLHTIVLQSSLPTITDQVTIDGYTQAGASVNTAAVGSNAVLRIELTGNAVGGIDGLRLDTGSDGSTVRGLVIDNLSAGAGTVFVASSNNRIVGNFINADATGTAVLAPAGVPAISLSGATTLNTQIGGSALADRNLIAADATGYGILSGGRGSLILGNLFNVSATGASLGPMTYGIFAFAQSTATVGGTGANDGNVFAAAKGIELSGGGAFVYLGNRFVAGAPGSGVNLNNGVAAGPDPNDAGDADSRGSNTLQNYPVLTGAVTTGSAVRVTGSFNSTPNSSFRIELFAGSVAANFGAGNAERYLGFANVSTDASGNATLNVLLFAPVAVGEFVTATATETDTGFTSFVSTSELSLDVVARAPVLITSNGGGTIAAVGVAENTSAVTTVAASGSGVTYALVGGADQARFAIDAGTGALSFVTPPDFEAPADAGANNVYDVIVQASDGVSSATQSIAVTVTDVASTLVVTTAADTNDAAIAVGAGYTNEWLNAHRGADGLISLREAIVAANNTAGADTITFNIAGTGLHTINVLTSLPRITDRITIDGYTQAGASVNTQAIGTNAVLTIQLTGNGATLDSIYLDAGSDGSTVRGLVVNNFNGGVFVSSSNNRLLGNFFEVNASGTAVATVNGTSGLWIYGAVAENNQIGSAARADRNLFGNGSSGSAIQLVGASRTIIQGNLIGTDTGGVAALGPANAGILITSGATGLLGGPGAGEGNVINARSGVAAGDAGAFAYLGNLIYGSLWPNSAIENGGNFGPDTNDAGDADARGTNGLQNYPVLNGAVTSGGSVHITGTLNSTPNGSFRVEFFAGAATYGWGAGDAERYLGFANVTTDASGNASLDVTFVAAVAIDDIVTATATATDSHGGPTEFVTTSEFAPNVVARAPVQITSNGGGATANVGIPEDSTAVTRVQASGSGITYALVGGADQARFAIDAGTGALRFIAAPDFDAPGDIGANNVYDVVVQAIDGLSTASQSIAVAVTNRNDAPALTPAAQAMTTVGEDDLNNAGQAVAEILGATVSDVDAGAVEGVAITQATAASAAGRWQYSIDNRATWVDFPPVSLGSALLLRATDLVRWVPNGQNASSGSFGYRAWDQSDGAAPGSRVDASTAGGTSAFSLASDTVSIAAAAVNDAPVLNPALPTLNQITEDQSTNPGQQVASFIGSSITDVDAGASQGIAVTATTNGNGRWEYALDGSTWLTLGAVGDGSALLLDASDWIRFVPDGRSGTSAAITYRAWDQTLGSAGARADTSAGGATGAFSAAHDTASITVLSVNDEPTTGSLLVNTPEDTPLTLLASMFHFADFVDSPPNNFLGVWIGFVDRGSLTLGGVDFSSGFVSAAQLGAGLLLFTPLPNVSGGLNVVHIRFQVQDDGGRANGGNDMDTLGRGNITVLMSAVNDAPVLDPTPVTLIGLNEDQLANAGQSVGSFAAAAIGDVDGSSALKGIAINAVDNGNGHWEYSTDGTTWIAIGGGGAVGDSNALLLRSTDAVRFVPDGRNGTSGSIGYRAWDRSSGVAGTQADASVNGGTSAFSSASASARVAVSSLNDAPVLTPIAPVLPSIVAGQGAGAGQTVASWVGGSIGDVDTGALQGIAITATATSSGTGTWQYSLDGGLSWSAVGAVADTSALLLGANDRVRFVSSGTGPTNATLTYRAWDQTVGTAGTRLDAGTAGGTAAFSLASDTASITVAATPTLPANTAPVITSDGGAATAAITVAENTHRVTTVTAVDADLPAQTLQYAIVGGADADRFTIDAASGLLRFVAAPDFERPTDANADNVYELEVAVDDGALIARQTMRVAVAPVDDNAPVFTGPGGGANTRIELTTDSVRVAHLTATDADLPTPTLRFAIAGGADAARFTIDAATGVLQLNASVHGGLAPSAAGNRSYDVIVQVSGGELTTRQPLLVVIAPDMDPPPMPTTPEPVDTRKPSTSGEPTSPVVKPPAESTKPNPTEATTRAATTPPALAPDPSLAAGTGNGFRFNLEVSAASRRSAAAVAATAATAASVAVASPAQVRHDELVTGDVPFEPQRAGSMSAAARGAARQIEASSLEVPPDAAAPAAGSKVQAMVSVGVVLSLGAVGWAARGVTLMTSVLVASPAWSSYDLWPVLKRRDDDLESDDSDDDDVPPTPFGDLAVTRTGRRDEPALELT